MKLLRMTLSAVLVGGALCQIGGALADPAVPVAVASAPQIRACNAAFRENAYTQGFAAARGLYSECLAVEHPADAPKKVEARTPKSVVRVAPAAQSRKVSCHSFSVSGGASPRVCLTTALAR